MAVSPDTLATQLTEAGLVTKAELDALREQHQPADAEALARLLVKHKVLTAYQAQQAYAGKSKALVLGNYIILDKLGQGGMGMVLKARHRRMNRIVALKVLSPAVTKTPDAMKRFQREVEAAAKLHHPHIVTAHDADEVNGTHFLVMEYVEGTDLSVLVKKKGPLPVDQVINCMLQAARGLEYAHRHGVIHRDIKPANLLLDKEGTIKVLDMGLARIEGETGANAELTSTGAVMGTVDYMAPEQALSTKSADARSDIYSLGISLWYLLIGRPVFEGDSLMARLIAHRESPPPSLKGARGEVPAALDALFQKMIAKKPADRCQSMTEVIAVLETCRLPQTSSEKSTPSFTTGPSEESKLSEFVGLFGGGTDPNSPTRSVPKMAGSATARAPASGSEYDVTVTSATGDTGSLPSPLASTASKPPTARPRWLLPGATLVGVAALLFVITILSTTKPDSPTTVATPPTTVAASPRGAGSESEPPTKDGKAVSVPSTLHNELVFDGVDDYVDLTSDWQWDGQELTFEAWLVPPPRQEVVPPAVTLMALEQGDPATGPRARLIQTLYKPSTGDPKPQIQVSSPARNEAFVSANALIAEQLTHVAAVWSGRETRLFIDGKLQPKSIYNFAFKPRHGEPYLWLGALRENTAEQKPISFWKGRIRQVRVTARAIYDGDFTPSPELVTSSDTVGLYRLEEGSGDVLKDSSGHNRHGKIHGATWRDPTRAQSSPVAITSGVELDGIDDYIDLTSDWAYDGGPITVEMWTTPGIPASDRMWAVLMRDEVPTGEPGNRMNLMYLQPQRLEDGERTGLLHFSRPPDGSVVAARHTFRAGVRIHLAAVFDGKDKTIFVDGRPKLRERLHWDWTPYIRERYWWIGASRSEEDDRPPGPVDTWTGIIHNVRVSSTARYTDEFVPQPDFEPDPLTEGLYRFDEGAGAIAKDSSGHNRHAKIIGGTWAAPGQPPASGPIDPAPGSSLHFDGEAAFVEVPTLQFDGTRPLTLEAWVLADLDESKERNWSIMGWNGGSVLYRVSSFPSYSFFGFGPQGEEAKGEMGAYPESRRMHHVAGVWDGTTLRAFLDGKPGGVQRVDQLFRTLRNNDALNGNFCIGASIWYGTGAKRDKGEFFKGYIDEVRVSQSARYSGEFTPSQRFEPDADTLALFHFDEGTGTVSRDASGKGHDGRIVGAKWTPPGAVSSNPPKGQSDTAVPTSGVELDGLDDYIDLTSDWTYDGGPVTVEMWATPGIPASDQAEAVLLRGEGPSGQSAARLKLMYRQPSTLDDGERTGELGFSRPPDVKVASARHTLQPGTRSHLAAVFDGTETTIFVDGRPKLRESKTYHWGPYSGTRYLWMGALRSQQTTSAGNWNGIIHKVRISSTARYSEEFVPQPDYEPDPQTEGLYRFDEGTGAVAKDASGKARHARIVGGTWAAPGQAPASGLINPAPGSYLQFDGVAACVEVPSLRFDGKKPLTLEAWVLADPDGRSDSLKTIAGWGGSASLSRVATVPWYLFWGYGPQGASARSEMGRSFDSRRLYHVAGVWDGASLTTFVDGKPGGPQQVAQLFEALRDDAAVKDHFCIGASITPGGSATQKKGEPFKGYIDEVRVSQSARYSGEFTPSQRFEPDADTLALFHFDEGSGGEVRDASGHGHHGKVVGAKWFTTSPTSAAIDLLKDLKANGEPAGNMKWTRDGQSVVGQGIASKPGSEWFGTMFPLEIPGSYDLEIEFNQRGCYPLHIDIPVGDTFCSFDMSPESCGLLEIDDKHGQEFGPPYHHKNVKLKSDVVQKFAVSVRLTGDDVVVKGTLDGELIGEFSGKRKRLSLPHWVNRKKPQVFIGALADLRNVSLVMPRATVRTRSEGTP